MVADELVHVGDGIGLGLEGLVLGDERGDGFLGLAGEDFADALEAELLDAGAGLARAQARKAPSLALQGSPFGFGEGRLVAEQRLDDSGIESGDRAGPGGVEPSLSGSGRLALDARQRETRRSQRR